MKRFTCQCGAQAVAGSERWPSIKLCHECFQKVAKYFMTHMPTTLDHNPLAVEILGLEQHGDRCRLWNIDDDFTAREFYFKTRRDDS